MHRAEAALREATREWQRWADLHARIEQLAEDVEAIQGQRPDEKPTEDDSESEADIEWITIPADPAQVRAVRIVKENGAPMTVAAVDELLPDVKRKTVGWALWNAVRDGELKR